MQGFYSFLQTSKGPCETTYTYSVKVINPFDKGGYEVHAMESQGKFLQVSDLEKSILTNCEDFIEDEKAILFGYIAPGHGKKGKQVPVSSNHDLQDMYER